MRPDAILGIDASLRALGAFVIPCDWDMRPERCKGYTLGVDLPKNASPQQLVERLRMLSVDLVTIVHKHNVRHVWIESYAYGMNTAAHSLGELGGVIKLDLWREARIVVETGNQSAARKFVYGQMPPRGIDSKQRKAWLFEPLKLAGLPVADHNQSDAAVQALYGASELGVPTLCGLLGPAAPKAKRTSKPVLGDTLETLVLPASSTADFRLAVVNRMVDLGVIRGEQMQALLQGDAKEEARRIREALQHAKAAASKAKRSKRKAA